MLTTIKIMISMQNQLEKNPLMQKIKSKNLKIKGEQRKERLGCSSSQRETKKGLDFQVIRTVDEVDTLTTQSVSRDLSSFLWSCYGYNVTFSGVWEDAECLGRGPRCSASWVVYDANSAPQLRGSNFWWPWGKVGSLSLV